MLNFLAPILIINFFSMLTLASINYSLVFNQILKLILALGIIYIISNTVSQFWDTTASAFYVLSLILLTVNLIQMHQINRWVSIAGIAVQFSEFAKISLILMLAKFLSIYEMTIMNFIKASLIILIPTFLIFKQPNLGTSLIFLATGFGMIWMRGINRKAIIGFFIALVAALPILWSKMLPYQKSRIIAFLNPTADPQGSSYQTIQSIIAIGSGGLFGSSGLHNKLGFVPENHTDFLFSYFCERFGFIFALILICVIFFSIINLLNYEYVKDKFTKFFVTGFAILWLVESIMNIGMNLGLLPVTGIALPCFSYGGSSLLSFCIMYGIVFNLLKNKC